MAGIAVLLSTIAVAGFAHAQSDEQLHERMDALEAEISLAEDMRAIKKLQRAYGYYLDKGMWGDLAELFSDNAIVMYPDGTWIGYLSIRRHLFLNAGATEMGQDGLAPGRLYNHMIMQPVVHIDPGGMSALGRWRGLAMLGDYEGSATWAEGVYEVGYLKDEGDWKIDTLVYYNGFAAPYETGWVDPGESAAQADPPVLRHPPDQPRDMPCDGFPAACIALFHYENPGTNAEAARAWTTGTDVVRDDSLDPEERAALLQRRATVLRDEQIVENLQRMYGYYVDRRMWDDVADLFAEDATIELGMRGVYEGRDSIREFLELLGPQGLAEGELNDHVQLQIIVDVAPDGLTAKSRSREFNMTGEHEVGGQWSEGIFTNTFVKEDDIWQIASMRYYPTFITDYELGWAQDAQAAPGVSEELPPDEGPTDEYTIYPDVYIPPFPYINPVTEQLPRYPIGAGRPADSAIISALSPVDDLERLRDARDVEAAIEQAQQLVARTKDYHEIENLENTYGYYMDKNLWNLLAGLFAENGSMELAQRGAYQGRERVRDFLFNVFGDQGPVEGRLGNHIKIQPVITIARDGESAQVRARTMQQLFLGQSASMGAAVYENTVVKEDGIWKFESVHAFNTWMAGYDGGWAHNPDTDVPGPSEEFPPDAPPSVEFEMFPSVHELPFHYDNPVSGRSAPRVR